MIVGPAWQIIDESEERLSDAEVEELLELVRTTLPGDPQPADDEGGIS